MRLGYMENHASSLNAHRNCAPPKVLLLLVVLFFPLLPVAAQLQGADPAPDLQKAATNGDLRLLRDRLLAGDNPNARDADRRTPLINAVRAGQSAAARLLLRSGADVNAKDRNGVTALIEAAHKGNPKGAALLIEAGADVNVQTRGPGSALDAAERAGHQDIVALLRNAGARTTGKSVGDKVCVRPWNGDGYCGLVESCSRNDFKVRVTDIVGCAGGCPAKAECSAGREVGGTHGLQVGDPVSTVGWCLTETGVQQ